MPKRVLEEIAKDVAAESIGKKMKRTSASAWIARESKVCPYCKKEFLPRAHNQLTCGAEKCKYEHKLSKPAKMYEAKCVICGAPFMRMANKGTNAAQTCGQRCADLFRKQRMAENTRTCEECGKNFKQYAPGAKYCLRCKDVVRKQTRHTRVADLPPRKFAQRQYQVLETFEIDFAQLSTMCAEYPTMDCQECDPLTNRMDNGVWFEVIEKPKQTRKAA